jgi:hypothetical protein
MSITTLDGALAGMQPPQPILKALPSAVALGRAYSLWGMAGAPGPGSVNSSLNGAIYSSSTGMVAGQIPHTDPAGGLNSYLARLSLFNCNSGTLFLVDRIWDNGGFTITSTTAQNITSPTWPSRDNTGSTNGAGVLLGVEVSATVGAATPTITVSYTNSAGTASRTGTNADATQSAAVTGSFFRIGLAAGDIGVQSVQSLTLSASWISGTINLVAYRVLAAIEYAQSNVGNALDILTGGFPQLYNGIVPYLIFVAGTTNATTISGTYTESQG